MPLSLALLPPRVRLFLLHLKRLLPRVPLSLALLPPRVRFFLAPLQLLRIGCGGSPLTLGHSKIGDVCVQQPRRGFPFLLGISGTGGEVSQPGRELGQQRDRFHVKAGTKGRVGPKALSIARKPHGYAILAIGLVTVVTGEHPAVIKTVRGTDQGFQLGEFRLNEMCAHQTGPQRGVALAEAQHCHPSAFECSHYYRGVHQAELLVLLQPHVVLSEQLIPATIRIEFRVAHPRLVRWEADNNRSAGNTCHLGSGLGTQGDGNMLEHVQRYHRIKASLREWQRCGVGHHKVLLVPFGVQVGVQQRRLRQELP